MRYRTMAVLALAAAVGLLAATGCVSKTMFRENAQKTETRIDSVEDAVEANERRMGDLRTETDSKLGEMSGKVNRAEQLGQNAMQRADEAKQTADRASQGKLLWSVTLTDDRAKFDVGKSELGPDAASTLEEVVRRIKGMGKGVYLEIEGHTDSTGGEALNLKLGEERAMAVRNYLNEKGGIPLHLMSTISYGEGRPVADNSSRAGRAQNRRVVVRVLE